MEKIKKERANKRTNEVVLLVTLDDQGFSHFSLLNFLDLSIVSEKKILFAVGSGSSSARNLIERKRATIAFWTGSRRGSMIYVKGHAKQVSKRPTSPVEGFSTSAFILDVRSVLEDISPKAKIISTLTYRIGNINRDHLALAKDLETVAHELRKTGLL